MTDDYKKGYRDGFTDGYNAGKNQPVNLPYTSSVKYYISTCQVCHLDMTNSLALASCHNVNCPSKVTYITTGE